METGNAAIGITVESIGALQEALGHLLSTSAPRQETSPENASTRDVPTQNTPSRASLKDIAAKVTAVHNMLQAISLQIANTYRNLVAEDLAAPDLQGRRAPLTGRRLAQESRRVTAQDLSPAWRISPSAARNRVGLARTATELLPACVESLRRGEAAEDQLSAVMRASVVLTREDQAHMDHDLAPALPSMTVAQTKAAAFARACELDAASMVERAERAAKDAHVSTRPAPDCMSRLSALLPLKDGVAVEVALTRHAQRLKAQGDPRGLGRIKAALLVKWVRDGAARADAGQATWETQSTNQGASGDAGSATTTPLDQATTPPASSPGTTPRIEVQVVITDLALLGATDTPALVHGYGTVPAGVARQIICAASSEGQATLRRLWTSPRDRALTKMESRARFFPPGLERLIRTRDQVCRTPYCGAPIRTIDHVRPHAAGGATSATNGQGLCAACNQAKEFTSVQSGPPPRIPQESAASLVAHGLAPPVVLRSAG